MSNTVKYAASLAGIGFAIMVIPGIIFILCGLPLLVASFGLSLGVILCIKGKIAQRIFGSENYRTSTTGLAIVIFILTGFKLLTSIFTIISYMQLEPMLIRDSAFIAEQYIPVLISALFWSAMIFAAVMLRNKFRKPSAKISKTNKLVESDTIPLKRLKYKDIVYLDGIGECEYGDKFEGKNIFAKPNSEILMLTKDEVISTARSIKNDNGEKWIANNK